MRDRPAQVLKGPDPVGPRRCFASRLVRAATWDSSSGETEDCSAGETEDCSGGQMEDCSDGQQARSARPQAAVAEAEAGVAFVARVTLATNPKRSEDSPKVLSNVRLAHRPCRKSVMGASLAWLCGGYHRTCNFSSGPPAPDGPHALVQRLDASLPPPGGGSRGGCIQLALCKRDARWRATL